MDLEMERPVFTNLEKMLKIAQDDDAKSSFTKSYTNVLDKAFSWGRKASLWGFAYGLKCCSIEMMAFGVSRYDCDRYGIIFRASPRQSDLMFVAGLVSKMMAPRLKRLYDQMADPKYVIAMGECAISGGPYHDSYSIVAGVDRVVPVDVYIPGCPPTPEALFDGVIRLQERIQKYGKLGGSIAMPVPEEKR